MYNSPATPTGTNPPLSSSTYTCVFPIGFPITTSQPASLTRASVDQIVVSVGPYRFHTLLLRRTSASLNSPLNASPPHRTLIFSSPSQPLSISIRHVAAVACITLTPLAPNRRPTSCPSPPCARLATTPRPPTSNGRYNSSPAMSNDNVVTASIWSSLPSPSSALIDSRKLCNASCVICT